MRVFAGVDCGATNLRVGLVDEAGKMLNFCKIPSPLKSNPENFAKVVKEELNKLLVSQVFDSEVTQARGGLALEPIAIGVGTPGPLDLGKGLILPSSNLGNEKPIDLKHQFEREFSSPIYFDRDTNLALLGEAWQGAAKDTKNAVMLTLGTGVGGAIMVDREIDRGENGQAGELGHMILCINDVNLLPICGLGHKGCLEALINSAKDLDEMGTFLGYGLANIINIFNPDKIIIGGGKVKMGDFLPKAIEVMKQAGMKPAVDEVEVVYANLGDSSGIFGGVRLAYDSSCY